MNIVKLFIDGGFVMYPLLAGSIITVTLAIERIFFWHRIRHQRHIASIILSLYASRPEMAIKRLQQEQNLPLGRIFIAALTLSGATPEEFALAIASAAQAEVPKLKRFNNIFDMVISLAPLLGLLGTVTGLIGSFASLKLGSGGGNISGVTGGISEALISTAAGLVVAIVAAFFSNIFRNQYQQQLVEIQEFTSSLELLQRRHFLQKIREASPAIINQ